MASFHSALGHIDVLLSSLVRGLGTAKSCNTTAPTMSPCRWHPILWSYFTLSALL